METSDGESLAIEFDSRLRSSKEVIADPIEEGIAPVS